MLFCEGEQVYTSHSSLGSSSCHVVVDHSMHGDPCTKKARHKCVLYIYVTLHVYSAYVYIYNAWFEDTKAIGLSVCFISRIQTEFILQFKTIHYSNYNNKKQSLFLD